MIDVPFLFRGINIFRRWPHYLVVDSSYVLPGHQEPLPHWASRCNPALYARGEIERLGLVLIVLLRRPRVNTMMNSAGTTRRVRETLHGSASSRSLGSSQIKSC
jgi:hypothetical protein